MTKRTLEESKAFIIQTFKKIHREAYLTILTSDYSIAKELNEDNPTNNNSEQIVDFYFEKYLPDIFLDAFSLNTSKAGFNQELIHKMEVVRFIFKNYLDGNLSSKIWQEKIWREMTLEQKLLFLKTRHVEQGAMYYLAEANNPKMLQEYLAYYTQLLQSETLNAQQRELLQDSLHKITVETIKALLKSSQDAQPSECLGILFDMLKQNAIASKLNDPLKEKQLWYFHIDQQALQMKHKIKFMDYFVELCYEFFQNSNSYTQGEENTGPKVNPINLLIKLLKSHLTEAEYKEFDALFKGKFNELFLNQPIMEAAWKAYNSEHQVQQKDPVATTPVITTNQPDNIPQTQPKIEYLSQAIQNLINAINTLDAYGKQLQEEKASKGGIITGLATHLLMYVKALPTQPTEDDFKTLRDSFEYSIDQSSLAIKEYRVNLYTIFKNIAIALTGIGAIIQVGYWGYQIATTGKGLFFYQKPTTTSEDKLENVNQNLDELGKQIKNP